MRTTEEGGTRGWIIGGLAVLLMLVLSADDLRAVEFLNADANSDRKVSISDAYFTFAFLFGGGVLPECGDALDTDGDGNVNISDGIATLNYLLGGGEPPAESERSPARSATSTR